MGLMATMKAQGCEVGWEATWSYKKSQSPGPVTYKMYTNWHISLNLSVLQFCHLCSKLFQRIGATIK